MEEHSLEEDIGPEALITITPIIQVKSDETYQQEPIEFTFRNELVISSFHWGENRLRIQCRDIYEDICWQQTK